MHPYFFCTLWNDVRVCWRKMKNFGRSWIGRVLPDATSWTNFRVECAWTGFPFSAWCCWTGAPLLNESASRCAPPILSKHTPPKMLFLPLGHERECAAGCTPFFPCESCWTELCVMCNRELQGCCVLPKIRGSTSSSFSRLDHVPDAPPKLKSTPPLSS
ncbi:hypothetical protein LR48_Vigan2363s000100 [Vigna angularis]|nr:hypothetical protein LR48_Vigan2363s000100 [Vigna angularis]